MNTPDDDTHLDIVVAGTSKWPSIVRLIEVSGIPSSPIVAIGDDEPDLDMLEGAGIGIAMANATNRVKEISDLQAPANEADGVAQILELLVASR